MCDFYSCILCLISAQTVLKTSLKTLNIHFLTLDFSKQNGASVNFRTSLHRHNVIYTHATFSRTKASAKWSVTAATHSSVTSCMHFRAQFRLFQVNAMFKQHVDLVIWTWILRFQTASRNEFPCKNSGLHNFGKSYDVHNNVEYIMTKVKRFTAEMRLVSWARCDIDCIGCWSLHPCLLLR